MSTKRKWSLSTYQPAKKKRKAIDLDTKMVVIKRHEGGQKVNVIAREMRLSHSTVSTILKDKERIRDAVEGSAPMHSTVITKQRTGPIHEMEKLLHAWIEEQIRNRTPVSLLTVQAKARSLFQTLKERAGRSYGREFVASTGWFKRFERRFRLQNVRLGSFVDELDGVIAEEGYLAEQIFSAHETGLFWKRMPARTCIHGDAESAPGRKAFRDRLAVLLGGNVAGFKLKPFVIYHTETPRALRDVNKHTLPVHFRSNHRARMTQELFEDWFVNCFIPPVREYCLGRGVPFRVLLLLDDAPGHPPNLTDLHRDVKVVFMPPNAPRLIQGSIAAFKAHYLRVTFAQALAATDVDAHLSLRDFWMQYNILKSIKNVATAWEAVPERCVNGAWTNCVKRYALNARAESERELDATRGKIVRLAEELSLECDARDVAELLDAECGEYSNEELIELEIERVAEEEEEDEEAQRTFTGQGLSEGLSHLNKLLAHFEAMDPNVERFLRIERMVLDAFRPYREIYEEKKKQTIQAKIRVFVKKAPADDEGAQPSTSEAGGL
ncbi:tigger transposable element-derived protein 1-like [Brachionichthys hirsutus]|uniref:tigger transposable element-derived protein 1-like n=1 Tax=Brachionichthys hirsutus TaxID=412623 RepID=UPI0036052C3E